MLSKQITPQRPPPCAVYVKSERVLIALACIVKITLALAFLILFPLVLGVPTDVVGCAGEVNEAVAWWAWGMFGMVYATEVLFHAAMYLSCTVKTSVQVRQTKTNYIYIYYNLYIYIILICIHIY